MSNQEKETSSSKPNKPDVHLPDLQDLQRRAARHRDSKQVISREEIEATVKATEQFLIPAEKTIQYFLNQGREVAENLKPIEGYVGVIGTGYPFYVINQGHYSFDVSEFSKFIAAIRQMADEDHQDTFDYSVLTSEQTGGVPKLKRPKQAKLPPRLTGKDLLKMLPDHDLFMIVDNPTPLTERDAEEILRRMGYSSIHGNLLDAMRHTQSVAEDLQDGRPSTEKLPVNFHILKKADVEEALAQAAAGFTDITIPSRALHYQWEAYPMNFWFDLIFSFTELDIQNKELAQKIRDTRKKVVALHGIDEIIDIIKHQSRRARRLLETPEIERILRERLESWK